MTLGTDYFASNVASKMTDIEEELGQFPPPLPQRSNDHCVIHFDVLSCSHFEVTNDEGSVRCIDRSTMSYVMQLLLSDVLS